MPNPAGATGVPNLASYDTTSVPGVVIDNVTGLWWQQPLGGTNNQGVNEGGMPQSEAITYCAHLNLGGHCDWRLPTRIELISIVDFTTWNPAINGSVFPGTPSQPFWTASPYLVNGAVGYAWGVTFLDGSTSSFAAGQTNYVRCVR
jgi:Protein of unknown function (DUF1566)